MITVQIEYGESPVGPRGGPASFVYRPHFVLLITRPGPAGPVRLLCYRSYSAIHTSPPHINWERLDPDCNVVGDLGRLGLSAWETLGESLGLDVLSAAVFGSTAYERYCFAISEALATLRASQEVGASFMTYVDDLSYDLNLPGQD